MRRKVRGATAASKKRRRGKVDPNPNPSPPPPSSDLPQRQSRREGADPSPSTEGGRRPPVSNKRSSVHEADYGGDHALLDGTAARSRKKIRRRPSERCRPTLLVMPPSAPLPLAACQPASLFAMLLVASLLPKNTFSLRWLALSGVGVGVVGSGAAAAAGRRGVGRYCVVKSNLEWMLFSGGDNDEVLSSWSTAALDPEGRSSPREETTQGGESENAELWNRHALLALWSDVAAALGEAAKDNGDCAHSPLGENDESWDWSIVDSILSTIPRGGGDRGGDEMTYPGLVNMGNTCYINAQLQCAYHIPYLRRLVLDAKDEVVKVEVEVEVETDDDEEVAQIEGLGEDVAVATCENHPESDCLIVNLDDGTMTESAEDPIDERIPELEDDAESSTGHLTNDDARQPFVVKKKTIVKKVTKEEFVPISQALRALKVTFNSLGNSSSSSGSTSVLCRTLGIDPYVQQDGQEFWKLFIPEIRHDQLARLYGGYFEDYVREILPESEVPTDEELVMAAEDYGEEKKDEEEFNVFSTNGAENIKARERIRKELFSDLSIPVSEGTGGSVESTLRDMFTQPETLRVSEGNGWRPSKGAEKVDAYKGASLKRDGLPSLLQLHLKRFKYDYETGETSKINDCCSFPLELDLSEISEQCHDREVDAEGDAIYDLQSIVIHKGEYGSGHYYSYVRPDIQTNEWYRFDDEFVTRVDFTDVIVDAYGGSCAALRKRTRSDSFESIDAQQGQRRGLLRRILSLLGLFRRMTMIRSRTLDRRSGFGYGGRTSNAYMLQYVHRSDVPKLYNT